MLYVHKNVFSRIVQLRTYVRMYSILLKMSQYVHLLLMLPIITFSIALKDVSEHAYIFHLLFTVVIFLIVGET